MSQHRFVAESACGHCPLCSVCIKISVYAVLQILGVSEGHGALALVAQTPAEASEQ